MIIQSHHLHMKGEATVICCQTALEQTAAFYLSSDIKGLEWDKDYLAWQAFKDPSSSNTEMFLGKIMKGFNLSLVAIPIILAWNLPPSPNLVKAKTTCFAFSPKMVVLHISEGYMQTSSSSHEAEASRQR